MRAGTRLLSSFSIHWCQCGHQDPGVSFEIDYDPRSRYEFKIDEVADVTSGREWNWASAKPGEWIFDEKRKNFGAGSSIEFRDEKVP